MTIAGDRPPRYGEVWIPFVSPTVLHRDPEVSPTPVGNFSCISILFLVELAIIFKK